MSVDRRSLLKAAAASVAAMFVPKTAAKATEKPNRSVRMQAFLDYNSCWNFDQPRMVYDYGLYPTLNPHRTIDRPFPCDGPVYDPSRYWWPDDARR